MVKQEYECAWCGKKFLRYSCYMKGKKFAFCCRQCLAAFSSKKQNPVRYAELKDYSGISANMRAINIKLNPDKMNILTRTKLRNAHLNTGEGKTYTKYYSRLAHRVVAERKLGRRLKPEEVVHHMDFNKRNNDPENLMIFASSYDHMRYHAKLKKFFNRGFIDDWVVVEVTE